MSYPRVYASDFPVLIWGRSKSAFRAATEIGSCLPVLWAFSGEPVGQPAGVTVLANSRLVKVTGACGDFTAQIETGGCLTQRMAGAIIIFSEPECDLAAAIKAAGDAEHPLTMVISLEKIRPGDFRKIVDESLALTSQGHQVYLVVDEVQVGFPGGEELCQQAREAGVIFLKDTVLSFDDKDPGGKTKLLAQREKISDPGYREWHNRTVYLTSGSLRKTEPLVIEADRVWFSADSQAGFDYQAILKLLDVAMDRQEYYPFRTCREGILVVDPGWGEPFTEEETIALLKIMLQSWAEETRPVCNYEIEPDLCALCLTCYRTCPHQAVRFGQKSQNMYGQAMLIDPNACFNCGRCYAECPAQAIKQVLPQDTTTDTMVLACENSGGMLLRDMGIPCKLFPCAGSIGVTDILKAWEPGVDQLVIMTCRDGKCQHGSGGKRLSLRVERLARLFKSLTNPVHIEVIQVSAQDRVDEIRRRVGRL